MTARACETGRLLTDQERHACRALVQAGFRFAKIPVIGAITIRTNAMSMARHTANDRIEDSAYSWRLAPGYRQRKKLHGEVDPFVRKRTRT
jgi:hypothetical protein